MNTDKIHVIRVPKLGFSIIRQTPVYLMMGG
jgi:hypothetical protein